MPVLQQIAVFVLEIFWGVMLGFLLDCYQQARKICSFRNRGTSLGDFLFWLLATVLTACFLMLVNWGEVRVYVFLAMVLGVLLYFKFLGCSFILSSWGHRSAGVWERWGRFSASPWRGAQNFSGLCGGKAGFY